MKEAEFVVVFDGDMLGQSSTLVGGRFGQHILPVEPQALVGDFGGCDFNGSQ